MNGADDAALAARKLKCPRCGRVAFVDPHAGGVGTRCPSCGGVHLAASDVEHILCHELGLRTSELRAEAITPSHGGELALCSSCDGPLSVVELESVTVDLCLRCGAGWLDAGELERLTHGRHLERAPPSALARAFLPKAITPGRSSKRAVIAAPIKKDGLFASLVAGTIPAGCLGILTESPAIGVQVGLPITLGCLAVWALSTFAWRGRLVVDRARGTVRARHLGAPPAADTLPIDAVRGLVVEPSHPRDARGRVLAWHVSARVDGPEPVRWFTSRDRLLAHRLAFQLSQVLEVPVETPDDDDDA